MPKLMDPADVTLPESNWVFRRWFSFLCAAALVGVLAVHPVWAVSLPLMVIIVCYIVGASGEQVARMVQTSKLTEIVTKAASVASDAVDTAGAVVAKVEATVSPKVEGND